MSSKTSEAETEAVLEPADDLESTSPAEEIIEDKPRRNFKIKINDRLVTICDSKKSGELCSPVDVIARPLATQVRRER